jgi:hypothetical protein
MRTASRDRNAHSDSSKTIRDRYFLVVASYSIFLRDPFTRSLTSQSVLQHMRVLVARRSANFRFIFTFIYHVVVRLSKNSLVL